jgi:hypothetical protein
LAVRVRFLTAFLTSAVPKVIPEPTTEPPAEVADVGMEAAPNELLVVLMVLIPPKPQESLVAFVLVASILLEESLVLPLKSKLMGDVAVAAVAVVAVVVAATSLTALLDCKKSNDDGAVVGAVLVVVVVAAAADGVDDRKPKALPRETELAVAEAVPLLVALSLVLPPLGALSVGEGIIPPLPVMTLAFDDVVEVELDIMFKKEKAELVAAAVASVGAALSLFPLVPSVAADAAGEAAAVAGLAAPPFKSKPPNMLLDKSNDTDSRANSKTRFC